jgi:hypothetical protein
VRPFELCHDEFWNCKGEEEERMLKSKDKRKKPG